MIPLPLKIIFNPMGKVVDAEKGDNLLDVMRLGEIRIESLCGGKGECGKCKVILEKGKIKKKSTLPDKLLHPNEIRENYYLACMVTLQSDCIFTIPVGSRIESPKILLNAEISLKKLDPLSQKFLVDTKSNINHNFPFKSIKLRNYTGVQPRASEEIYNKLQTFLNDVAATALISRARGYPEIIDIERGDNTQMNFGLAFDLGTTTIVGLLVDLNNGNVLNRASELNGQITYGEELVTRLSYARKREGLLRLQRAAVDTVKKIIDKLTFEVGLSPSFITDVCVAGNTVMNHLLVGVDSAYLEEAGVIVSRDPIIVKAKSIGLDLHPEAYLYCLPNVSRFLGGDAIGDILTSNIHQSEGVNLIVDLGTNGEIIFGNKHWLFSSSCASGPAFEGEGVRHGMRAARGGIDHVRIDPTTHEAIYSVIEGGRAKGICGSGLIDLVAELYRVKLMDFAGKFIPDSSLLIREGKWGLEYVVTPSVKTEIGQDIVITQADLDYVIDSKAAACGAITVLMKKLKLDIYDINNVYLAGAFGTYSDFENVTKLGILPELPNAEIHPIGNGSLAGSYLTLVSNEKRKEARETATKTVYIDLLVDVEFMEEYSKALYIPGDKEYFPSYKQYT
ncbi:MAG: ASKHA domain-containing protein [Candidatus Bathyarchaeota archaeon]|nr:ASKHA domain-containing protein [Candidatus Bathyarchaeota archaeon]